MQRFCIHRTAVVFLRSQRWKRAMKKGSLEALEAKPHPGSKPRLNVVDGYMMEPGVTHEAQQSARIHYDYTGERTNWLIDSVLEFTTIGE